MTADLKTILEGSLEHLKAHADAGIGTAVTRVRIRPGSVTCDIEDGAWKLIADEMPGDGGAGLGPDPGVFGRAALGSCVAMGYVMWAAYLDVPLTNIEVIIEADYDAHGMLGIDLSSRPGWTGLRYMVNIESPAGEDRVREMVDHADRYSSLLDDFSRGHDIKRELVVTQG